MVQLYARKGGEILVNTTTLGSQEYAQLERLANGGFVATWTEQLPDGSDAEVRAQLFDANGNKLGGEFQVNTSTAAFQYGSKVAGLPSGRFVVIWEDQSGNGGDVSPAAIKGQLFEANGAKVGGEFLVNTAVANSQSTPAVTELAGGGFVVTWEDRSLEGGDASVSSIKAQLFDASAAKIGGEFLVNSTTAGTQMMPVIASLAAGGFVAAWVDLSATDGEIGSGVRAQRFDASGAKVGAEIRVNTITTGSQSGCAITNLEGGGFVVTWSDGSRLNDQNSTGIKAQLFDAAGAKIGGEFLVNTITQGDQFSSRVVALPGGGFVVTWGSGSSLDLSQREVKGQIFDGAGSKVGTEFLVNNVTAGEQAWSSIAVLPSGDIVISWTDRSGVGSDTSGSASKIQIITPTTAAPSDIILTNSTVSETAISNFAFAQIGAVGALNSTFTYEIVSDPTGGAFRLEGDLLVVANNHKLDFETAPTVNVRIRATDLNGQSFEETIALTVTDALVEARYTAQTSHLSYGAPGTSHFGSTIVALANGGSLVIWSADPNNAQFGQFRDATGAAIGQPFDLGIATIYPFERAVLALPSGGFIVAFRGSSNGEWVVSAQFYNSSGAKVGSEILVGPAIPSNPVMPSMVHLDSGEIIVAWHAGEIGATDVYAQRLGPAGTKIGTAFKVNTSEPGEQGGPDIVALPNGGFVISWADGASQGIRAQRFDNAGAKQGGELVLIASREDLYNADLAALEDGSLVLLIVDDIGDFNGSTFYSLSFQRYDTSGTKIGSEIAVTPAALVPNAQLIALPNGGFAVTWENVLGDIQVQLYSATGAAAGDSFLANGGLIGSSADFSMSATGSGDLLFSWTRVDVNESGTGRGYISDRRFTPGEPAAPPASNAPPTVTTSPGAINYVEGTNSQTAVAIDPALGVADPDNPYSGAIVAAKIQITGNYRAGEDQLSLPQGMTGNGAFDSATGILTITANDQQLSVDDWRLVIGNVRYINLSDAPSTAARTLTITVNDGTAWSAPATKTIAITPTNDAPTVDLDSTTFGNNAQVTYSGGGSPIAIMQNAIVTDADSPSFAGGAVRIERAANPGPGDVLAIQNQGSGAGQVGISGNVVSFGGAAIGTFTGGGVADLVITLGAGATAQAVQAVLRAVTYANSSSSPQIPGPQYAVTVSDGAGGTSTQRYSIINITPSAEPTIFDLNGAAPGTAGYVTYQAGAQAVAIAPDALLSDADTTNFAFCTFRFTLTNGSAGDSVALIAGGPIGLQGNDVTYNGITIGQLVNVDGGSADILLGLSATIDAVQAVVRALHYSNSSGNPATYSRTITVSVNEGSDAPNLYYASTATVGYGTDTPPTAVADAASVAANRTINVAVLANDTDPDGGPKGVAMIAGSAATVGVPLTLPSGARVTLNADGTLTYDPNGALGAGANDVFGYTLNGGSSANVAVSISAAIDTPPTAVADSSSVAANRTINIAVLANDTDPDGGPKGVATIAGLAATVGVPVTIASGARVTLNADGTLTYDPNGALSAGATDVFAYALNGGSSANVTVGITTAIDTPPTAVADSASVEANATTTIAVLLNDTDPDGGPKSVASIAGSTASVGTPITLVSGARVTLNADGTLTYDPNAALSAGATDTFSYTLNGGSSANVTVNITPGGGGDTPPTALADTASAAANATATIAVLLNDTDPDGGPKSVATIAGSAAAVGVPVTLASGARVTLNADGTLTYNPNGAVGVGATDTFSYALNGGSSANVSVSITAGTANGMLVGSPVADSFVGGAGPDSFNASQGGADQVTANGGNDGIYFGAAFGAGDVVDGGAGTDTLALQGNYASLLLSGVANVEVLLAASGSDTRFGDAANNRYDYNITTIDANLAAGGTLTVIGSELLAGEDLVFNGAAETDGRFRLFAGRGNDQLTGGSGGDGFFFGADGNLTGADRVNGGAGTDSIALRGNYVGANAVVFQDASFTNVEVLTFLSGHTNEFGGAINLNGFDYDVTLANGNIAAGQRLDVIAGNLRSNESARVDARAELDGSVRIISGAGDDILFGSAGNDILSGGLGADALDGSAGNDMYVYRTTAESTSSSRDTIAFGSGDRIDLSLIDANGGTAANEAFTFIGGAAFSNVAGQLRVVQAGANWIIEGDINGDGVADLVIAGTSAAPLVVADFIL